MKERKYINIYEYYKKLILNGLIKKNQKLPSIRKCADFFACSITTIVTAYSELLTDGYIYSKAHVGYFATDIAEIIMHQKKINTKKIAVKYKYDFTAVSADPDIFNFDLWKRYIKAALKKDERLVTYGEKQGEFELRNVLSKYLMENRNTVSYPENMLIGAGIQSVLNILCAILPQKSIYFYYDTFDEGKAIFLDHGFRITDIFDKADIIYISPSYRNYNGDIMSIEERFEFLKKCREQHKLIFEDDYDGEFGYFKHSVPSIQGLAGGTGVIYLNSFSRLLLPSIRLGFAIMPNEIKKKYDEKARLYNQTSSTIDQLALAAFISDGNLKRTFKKTVKTYIEKTELFSQLIELEFKNNAIIKKSDSGLFLSIAVNIDKINDYDIILRMENEGVKLQNIYFENKYCYFSVCCSSIKKQMLPEAAKALKHCFLTA